MSLDGGLGRGIHHDRRQFCRAAVGASASLLFSGRARPSFAQAKDPSVAELALYSGADRQKILEDGARQEKHLVEYGTYFEDKIIRPMFNRFRTRYPFLDLAVFRAETNDVVTRIETEHRANRNLFDAVQLSVIGLTGLKADGLITPYHTPSAGAIPAQFKQPEGYWVALGQSILCIGYNSNIVKPADAPKNYEDLLNPKWRGMISIPDGSTFTHWVEGLWEIWGRERARAYFEKLKLNQPRLRAESARAVADLIAAGQIPISPCVLNAHMAAVKSKGAPVGWASPDPSFSWIQGVSLATNAPHPHAALLWIDWLLSKEGSQALADVGYIPVDPSVRTKWPGLNEGNLHVINEIDERDRRQELNKIRSVVIAG